MSANVKSVTMIDMVHRRNSDLLWNTLFIGVFGTLMMVFARMTIPLPFTPVPITGQTFGVLLTGALLGRKRAALAMLLYLAEGMLGLPVFAGGLSAWSPSSVGLPVIIGPTAGYLFSYPLAAYVIGFFAERGWDRRFWKALIALVVGEGIIYVVGVTWLALYVGFPLALPLGFLPFIPGDILKLLLVALVLPGGWRGIEVLKNSWRR
ncbi:MAG: biotin transporter BioY [Ktedonobacteraceae bacterium]